MAKIYVADKPTLDEVNEKVSQIVTGDRKFFTVDDLFTDKKLVIGGDIASLTANTLTTVIDVKSPGLCHLVTFGGTASGSGGTGNLTLIVTIDGKVVCNKYFGILTGTPRGNGIFTGNLLTNSDRLLVPIDANYSTSFVSFVGPSSLQDSSNSFTYCPKPIKFNSSFKVEIKASNVSSNTLKFSYMYELD